MPGPLRDTHEPLGRWHGHCHERVSTLRAAGHGERALGERHSLGIGTAVGRCRNGRQIGRDRGSLMAHGDRDEAANDGTRCDEDEAKGHAEHRADPAILTHP